MLTNDEIKLAIETAENYPENISKDCWGYGPLQMPDVNEIEMNTTDEEIMEYG